MIRPPLLAVLAILAGCGGSGAATPDEIEALLAAGDLAVAEAEVKEALLRDPDDAALRLLRARIYLAEQHGAAAYAAFERARELGADESEVLGGMAESLLLQERYAEAVQLLDASAEAPRALPLLQLRLAAGLQVPLASPAELFGDARQWLERAPEQAATDLEKLASRPDVIAENAAHVQHALAYWFCQQPENGAVSSFRDDFAVYEPAWANLDESGRRILRVGPDEDLQTPGAAARVARDGDIVDIAAGTYGDVATWEANNLWLRANGGQVVLDSGGATAGNMGIWVIRGDNAVVEGVRFVGARSTHNNGSGIRFLAHNLWVRDSEFHDNEDGILTAGREGSEVVVERSVFTSNGASDGYSHNVYVGRAARLVFRFNYSVGARVGHELKSRALENYVLYNRLADGLDGDSSYTIDLSEGGFALILGNELQQGPRTVNRHMISLGAEDRQDREHRFVFAYNTFYNHTSPATFIRDATGAGIALVNNVFAGAPANIDAAITTRTGNAFGATAGLRDGGSGDFGLEPSAAFIDGGDPRETLDGTAVVPQFEYVHPAGARPRQPVWRPDPGAHEFCGWPD